MHKTGSNVLMPCWQTDPTYSDSLTALAKLPFLKGTARRTHKPDAKVCCVPELMPSGG